MSYVDDRDGTTALEALESAVALPNVYSKGELKRFLRRNNYDVMKSALELREKHEWKQGERLLQLNVSHVRTELQKEYIYFLDEAMDNDRCPIILIRVCKFHPNAASATATATTHSGGAVDGSTSLWEAQRTLVYLVDVATECAEDEGAPGIVYLIDAEHGSTANVDTTIIPALLGMLKDRFPETLHRVYVLNSSKVSRGVSHLLTSLMEETTKRKIIMCPEDPREAFDRLRQDIHPKYIPTVFGGQYVIPKVKEWMKEQAELEDIELDVEDDDALAGGTRNAENIRVSSTEQEFIVSEDIDDYPTADVLILK